MARFDPGPFIGAFGALGMMYLGYEVLVNFVAKKDCSGVGGGLGVGIVELAKGSFQCSKPTPDGVTAIANGVPVKGGTAAGGGSAGGGSAGTGAPTTQPTLGTPANGACNSSGMLYPLATAQYVYNSHGGKQPFDSNNFVGQCAGGYVVMVGGKWL